MIERYSRTKMKHLWSEEAKYQTWLDIEVLACEALAKINRIPKEALTAIKQKAKFSTEEILELEKNTRHDVAAFVSNVQASVGEYGKYIHYGLTSSDVVDTAFAYRLLKSSQLLSEEMTKLLEVVKTRAKEFRLVPVVGRTHGIHAEPMSFGQKWLLWYDQLSRCQQNLETATKVIAVGKLSGAVGNYAHLPPSIEEYVCHELGLGVDSLSTQVISRDRFAQYFSALAILGSVIEGICVELRHLQRTEVGEVRESFSKKQKGSSSMPHKRNPISAENLTGCARLLRGMLVPALEDCALWHERDISHSSVERVIGPDANILCDYMISRLSDLLEGLEVHPDQMEENLNRLHGIVYSQKALLALVEKGLSRDDAYEIIQRNSLKALDAQKALKDLLSEDQQVTKRLSQKELDSIFDPKSYFTHLDYLYEKVFGRGTNEKQNTRR